MNRRELMLAGVALGVAPTGILAQSPHSRKLRKPEQEAPAGSPPTILLNGYLPQSIYRIPVRDVKKAKFPVIDQHCHGHGPLSVVDMVKMMDVVGLEKTVIFTGAGTAERSKEVAHEYAGYPDRFEPWCLFDLRGFDQPGFGRDAIRSLEACHLAGARGVGELVDKGRGFATRPPADRPSGLANFIASLNDGPTSILITIGR